MGNMDQLRPMCCNQLLVGGTYALSAKQRSLCKLIGRLQSSHGFTDDLYLRII